MGAARYQHEGCPHTAGTESAITLAPVGFGRAASAAEHSDDLRQCATCSMPSSPNTGRRHPRAPAGGVWFKSSFSYPANYSVEVFVATKLVHIRDSRARGTGPVITVHADHWPKCLEESTNRTTVGGT